MLTWGLPTVSLITNCSWFLGKGCQTSRQPSDATTFCRAFGLHMLYKDVGMAVLHSKVTQSLVSRDLFDKQSATRLCIGPT